MTPTKTTKLQALLVDDHAIFRESVCRALSEKGEVDVRHCASIREALQTIVQTSIDIVLLDHDLGNERGSQFLPAARQAGFNGRVLIVTGWISAMEARRLLRQGVAGIFVKQGSLDQLMDAIRTVAAGGTWLEKRYSKPAEQDLELETKREEVAARPQFNEIQRKVLRLVVEGLSNKEIGWRLQISESYVKAILQRFFQTTGVRTRGQLIRVALEQYENQL